MSTCLHVLMYIHRYISTCTHVYLRRLTVSHSPMYSDADQWDILCSFAGPTFWSLAAQGQPLAPPILPWVKFSWPVCASSLGNGLPL